MKLSVAERWILVNQYRILLALEDQDVSLYTQAIEILENGYQEYYAFAAQYLQEEPFPEDVASEVQEILSMFRQMQWIKDRITDESITGSPLFEFWGFDGNNNPQHHEYAGLLHRLEKYTDIGDRLLANSHFDNIDTYRAMVDAWKKLEREGLNMTQEDVQAILDAPKLANLQFPEPDSFDA